MAEANAALCSDLQERADALMEHAIDEFTMRMKDLIARVADRLLLPEGHVEATVGLETMLLEQPDGAFSRQFHDAMVRSGVRGSPLAFAKKMDARQLQIAGREAGTDAALAADIDRLRAHPLYNAAAQRQPDDAKILENFKLLKPLFAR